MSDAVVAAHPNCSSAHTAKLLIHFTSNWPDHSNFASYAFVAVVSSGGAPTPAGTSVFTKHNWDMGMGYLWLNGWGINHLMGGAFMGIMT